MALLSSNRDTPKRVRNGRLLVQRDWVKVDTVRRVAAAGNAVSYTHLDVYKRQGLGSATQGGVGMRQLGDVTRINGAEIEPVDVITFGSPCQDLSIAGKQAGLDGERSGLFFAAVRIIKEMRETTNNERPTFAISENVPGADVYKRQLVGMYFARRTH